MDKKCPLMDNTPFTFTRNHPTGGTVSVSCEDNGASLETIVSLFERFLIASGFDLEGMELDLVERSRNT